MNCDCNCDCNEIQGGPVSLPRHKKVGPYLDLYLASQTLYILKYIGKTAKMSKTTQNCEIIFFWIAANKVIKVRQSYNAIPNT